MVRSASRPTWNAEVLAVNVPLRRPGFGFISAWKRHAHAWLILPIVTTSMYSPSPSRSNANMLSVRPKLCTSSSHTGMPAALHVSMSATKNSRGAVLKPPSPCTSSITKQACWPG